MFLNIIRLKPFQEEKNFGGDYFRIGVYDILFPSEPTVLTNSRIQNYVTFGGAYRPGNYDTGPKLTELAKHF